MQGMHDREEKESWKKNKLQNDLSPIIGDYQTNINRLIMFVFSLNEARAFPLSYHRTFRTNLHRLGYFLSLNQGAQSPFLFYQRPYYLFDWAIEMNDVNG